MVEITTTAILGVFNEVGNWLDRLIRSRAEQDETHRIAISKIYVASNETKFYLSDLEDGKKRSRKTEKKLSSLWTEAAIELRKIDRDLANRCLLKGDYWANPKKWSEDQVKVARIGVDKVFNDSRKLLGECII